MENKNLKNLMMFFYFIYLFIFLSSRLLKVWACGILVPWPEIEPGPSAVKAWSPNYWTTREFLPLEFWRHQQDLTFLEPGTVWEHYILS